MTNCVADAILCPHCSCPRVLRFNFAAIETVGSRTHESVDIFYVRPLLRCLNEECLTVWSDHEGEKAQEEALARYRRLLSPDEDRAFEMLFLCGITRERAKTVSNGIQVLDQRYRKQVQNLGLALSQWERMFDAWVKHQAGLPSEFPLWPNPAWPQDVAMVAHALAGIPKPAEAGGGIEPPTTGV